MAVADQPTVCERLWLLPDDINLPLAARASLRLIRRRLSLAMTRRESALLGVGRRLLWMLGEAMGKLQREEGTLEIHCTLILGRKKYPVA